jgi:tetratricopeptide (TPR) repeat protein
MNKWYKWIIIVVLSAFFLGAYSNHFQNTFHFDDSHTIQTNIYIRDLTNAGKFFYSPEMFSSLPSHWGLRPLVTLSLAIDYWLGGGLNPFFFHMSTFVVYIIMLLVLYFFYQKILNTNNKNNANNFIVLFLTAFFGIHTANAETINYIISRSDVYSTFFILLSFSIFIFFPTKRNRFFYVIPALLGVLTKETVLTLVILLFFYILLFEKKLSIADFFKKANLPKIGNTILRLLPLTIAVGILQFYTLSKIQTTTDISNPFFNYVLTQPYVWLRYFIAFFIPANLSADSDWTVIMNPFDERIIVGLSFLALLVYGIFHFSKKEETKAISFGLIWFAATLLPTSIAPFAEVTNDHRMFYAFIGLTLALGNVAILLWKKYSSQLKYSSPFFLFIGFVLIASHAYGVRERNKVWKTEESLWLDVTIKSPTNGRGLMNYGLTQMSKGNYIGANDYFQKAQQYVPYYPTLYVNMAILKSVTQQNVEADQYFKKALELTKGHEHGPYNFYGKFLINQQRFTDAEKILLESYQINKFDPEALKLLSQLYTQTQNWEKLNWSATNILKLDPNDNDGKLFLNQSIKKESIATTNQAVSVVEMLNRSLLLYNENKFDECINVCLEILKIEPNNANALNNIGAAYNMKKDWEKAAEYCQKALDINPNFNLAKGNLTWALSELKKKKQ